MFLLEGYKHGPISHARQQSKGESGTHAVVNKAALPACPRYACRRWSSAPCSRSTGPGQGKGGLTLETRWPVCAMRTLHSPQRRKRGGPLGRAGSIVGMEDSGVAGESGSCMGSFRGKRWRENENRGLAPCAYHGRGRACFSDVVVFSPGGG